MQQHQQPRKVQPPALPVPPFAKQSHHLKDKLTMAVDDDTNAFNSYMQARRLPQKTAEEVATRAASMQQGLKLAVEVPWSTAESCFEVIKATSLAMREGNPASITDAMVGMQMGFAGLRGGIWNVIINLKDITDSAFTTDMENRCNQLLAEARLILNESMNYGDTKLAEMLARK